MKTLRLRPRNRMSQMAVEPISQNLHERAALTAACVDVNRGGGERPASRSPATGAERPRAGPGRPASCPGTNVEPPLQAPPGLRSGLLWPQLGGGRAVHEDFWSPVNDVLFGARGCAAVTGRRFSPPLESHRKSWPGVSPSWDGPPPRGRCTCHPASGVEVALPAECCLLTLSPLTLGDL